MYAAMTVHHVVAVHHVVVAVHHVVAVHATGRVPVVKPVHMLLRY